MKIIMLAEVPLNGKFAFIEAPNLIHKLTTFEQHYAHGKPVCGVFDVITDKGRFKRCKANQYVIDYN